MISNSQNYDILSSSSNQLNETELVEVNPKNLTGKNSGYSNLNSNENETEFEENNEDYKDIKEQFNKSTIINNPLIKKDSGIIKFRKGNLHICFYDENGIPKIVIGPDCK